MKRSMTSLAALFIFSLVLFSCKKSKVKEQAKTITVDPLKNFNLLGATQESSDGSASPYQVGVRFLAHKEGRIVKLGLRSPSAATYRVQLYTFVASDSISLAYPLISPTDRLAYVDVTISAADAVAGRAVMVDIPAITIKKKDGEGAGKVRQYGVCFNDLDKTQFQYLLPTGTVMPLQFSSVLSLQRYSFSPTTDINLPAWTGTGSGFSNIVFGDVRFEFVTEQ